MNLEEFRAYAYGAPGSVGMGLPVKSIFKGHRP